MEERMGVCEKLQKLFVCVTELPSHRAGQLSGVG
jgi:hypothetical protein